MPEKPARGSAVNLLISEARVYLFKRQMEWFRAIRRGDSLGVAGLLVASLRTQTDGGYTGLMVAIQMGHYDIALTIARYEHSMVTDEGETALMLLCKAPHPLLAFGQEAKIPRTAKWVCKFTQIGKYAQGLALLKILAHHEATKVSDGGKTALMMAIETGNYDATVLLGNIEAGLSSEHGWSETMYLVLRGHDDRALFEENLQYERPRSGVTALMLAALVDNLRAARLFFGKEWGLKDTCGRSALMFAGIGGHTSIATLLWPREKNMRDREGRTAIMYATVYGNLDVVKLLVAAEGQSEDLAGWTAIIYAVVSWQHDVLDFLVENCHSLTQKTIYTALQYASIIGNYHAIESLLTKEGRIYTCDGETALILAAKYNRLSELNRCKASATAIQRLCVEEAAMVDMNQRTALMHAVLKGDREAVSLLQPLEGGLVDKEGKSALYYALEKEDLDIAHQLYSQEKHLNVPTDWSPLMLACVGCDTQRLSELTIEPGKQTKRGLTALMISCRVGFGDGVRTLCDLEAGHQDANGRSALMFAIHNRFSVGIECLIHKEAKLQDALGMTALMHLLRDNFGRYALTLSSLEAGLLDKSGLSSLMYAARAGVTLVVEILASVEHSIVAPNGWTALMFAAQAGQADCVPALASLQARKQNSRGLTAMMLAAYKGYASIVEILMPKETRIQDDEGRTALVYALFGQHKEVVKLLIDSERDIPTKTGKTALEYALSSSNPNITALFSEAPIPPAVESPTIDLRNFRTKSESQLTQKSPLLTKGKKASRK